MDCNLIKENKLYKLMSWVMIIWGCLTAIVLLLRLISGAGGAIDILIYGAQIVGSILPGFFGIRWRKLGPNYVMAGMVINIVLAVVVIIASGGSEILRFLILEVLFLAGAVLQLKYIREGRAEADKPVEADDDDKPAEE